MTEDAKTAGQLTVQELADRMDEALAEMVSLKAEIDRLKGRPAQNGAGVVTLGSNSSLEPRSTPIADTASTAGADGSGFVSRRGALLALGGAAGGVGMAIGSTFLGAGPAAATNGAPVLLGEGYPTNTATSTTAIVADLVGDPALGVSNPGSTLPGIAIAATTGGGSEIFTVGTIIGDTNGVAGPAVIGTNGTTAGGDTSYPGPGVYGVSVAQTGILFGPDEIQYSSGIIGENVSGVGVTGLGGGPGVPSEVGGGSQGVTNTPQCWGVYGAAVGTSGLPPVVATGVFGESNGGDGVRGASNAGHGVVGVTTFNGKSGVSASDNSVGGGFGVSGDSVNGIGIFGRALSGAGVGVKAQNNTGPSLMLVPQGLGSTLPAASSPGEFIVLNDGSLHYSYAPGEWINLAPQGLSFISVSPERAYDSRVSKGGPGPLNPGASRDISLTSGGLPAGASAALINVTIVNTANSGYLTVYETGASVPNVSNINWYQSGQITANNATPSVSSAGEVTVLCGGTGATDFLIDVFGYYP